VNALKLKHVSHEILERADTTLVPPGGLPKLIDDYFIERVKMDELAYASIDATHYEALREQLKQEVLPLYEEYYRLRDRVLERKQKRRLTVYVLGSIGVLQLFELLLSKGRSLEPQILIPTLLAQSFIGFLLYAAAGYKDDLSTKRARRNLENSLQGLDQKMAIDFTYEARRRLMDSEVMQAEVITLLAAYAQPAAFWEDYRRVREADPVTPAAFAALGAPAFAGFLRGHLDGSASMAARQTRFNHLFLLAHEVFIAKDREQYILRHLNQSR